jgi:hypothetical protein
MALSPAVCKATRWHPEAMDWLARVTQAGSTASASTMRAVSDFCQDIDTAGIRGRFLRLNLFCGGDLSGALVPLYRSAALGSTVIGNATDTSVGFVTADFVETDIGGGLKGSSAVVKYINTGLVSTFLSSGTSAHVSVSASGMSETPDRIIIGTYNGGGGLMCIDENNTASYGVNGGRATRLGSTGPGTFPFTKSFVSNEQHLIGSRESATKCVLYRNGQAVARNFTSVTITRTSNIPFYVFALNAGNAAITATSPATARMYSIGEGLGDTQAADFSAAVIAFNAALGRS